MLAYNDAIHRELHPLLNGAKISRFADGERVIVHEPGVAFDDGDGKGKPVKITLATNEELIVVRGIEPIQLN